jgi:hypothetical protein
LLQSNRLWAIHTAFWLKTIGRLFARVSSVRSVVVTKLICYPIINSCCLFTCHGWVWAACISNVLEDVVWMVEGPTQLAITTRQKANCELNNVPISYHITCLMWPSQCHDLGSCISLRTLIHSCFFILVLRAGVTLHSCRGANRLMRPSWRHG